MSKPKRVSRQIQKHPAVPSLDELHLWMNCRNVTKLIHAVDWGEWPEDVQLELARYDSEELRMTLARRKDCCRVAVDILFSADSPEVHFELLHAGHLTGRRAAQVRRELVDSPHPGVRKLATRLRWLPPSDRARLFSDPEVIVRHHMAMRRDLTAVERMKICQEEARPEVLRGFFVMSGGLTADEIGVLVPRMSQGSVRVWWHFLTNALENPNLPDYVHLSVAKCGDAVLRAHLAGNERCSDEALRVLFNDSSPTVLFALLEAGHLDKMRRTDVRGRLVNSENTSARGLAAQLSDLRVGFQRAGLLFDEQWTVRAAMAVRKDLSSSERLQARTDQHPGVRRAFAGRDDLADEEVLDLENDPSRGVVSAIAYNKKVLLPSRARADHRLTLMPKEAPSAKVLNALRNQLAPVREGVPILGFKSWTVRFNSVLCSWWRDELWESATKLAACADPATAEMDPESPIPHEGPHACGLYAHHDMASGHEHRVLGAVLGWGDVAVHEEGWRSQEMEIIALSPTRYDFSQQEMEEADALGAILNVPVVSKLELEAYARHFGQAIRKSTAHAQATQQQKKAKTVWGLT